MIHLSPCARTQGRSSRDIQSGSASEELKTLLQELAEEVAKIAKALPTDRAEELADDLKRLTGEVTKEKPRRKFWELSAKGIQEAAQAVGEIGKTAIMLLTKITPLLPPA